MMLDTKLLTTELLSLLMVLKVNHYFTYRFLSIIVGVWNTNKQYPNGNLAHRAEHKGWYFPVPPHDTTVDLRSEMLLTMGDVGIPIEKHHHEVATCQVS
jgi:glutamine synthetase